jgi:thymidylate synthase ThyX
LNLVKVEMGSGLEDLRHIEMKVPGGGDVYVLDTGAVIDSEAEAMLQALHSRSVGGLRHHLDVLEKKGADNFMKNFYVGYGHKSIGDCGSTTVFIEGVSMLAAKAIQDWRLYSGQEASTRYIDFSTQPFIDPIKTDESQEILESQRDFYLSILEPTKVYLKEQFPMTDGENEKVYEKAINSRVFDISRGFLPAGAATNLAWHSNLRQIADHLVFLRHHPLEEVRNIAHTLEDAVIEAHPNSFTKKRYLATEEFHDIVANQYFHNDLKVPDLEITIDINKDEVVRYRDIYMTRPPKTELPKFLSDSGLVYAEFKLDFGSFRDIQRHRAINQKMPLVSTEIGFNQWYLDSLPDETRSRAVEFLGELEGRLDNLQILDTLDVSKEVKQYYTPMGFNTSNSISGDLPAMVYMVELRATRFVHPTLRRIAKAIGEDIRDELEIPIHFDEDPDRFDIARGTHDIEIK